MTKSVDVSIKTEFAKLEDYNEELGIIYGWASVIETNGETVIDKQGDIIEEVDLVKAAHEFVSNERTAKFMHDGESIGEVVDSFVMTKSAQEAFGIDLGQSGWIIGMRIDSQELRKGIKEGKYTAFSIGGKAERVEV